MIGYLRAWAFEAQLRAFLREKFGNEWFARRDAGDLSASSGRKGRSRPPTSCSKDVHGREARVAAVADRVRESSRPPELARRRP